MDTINAQPGHARPARGCCSRGSGEGHFSVRVAARCRFAKPGAYRFQMVRPRRVTLSDCASSILIFQKPTMSSKAESSSAAANYGIKANINSAAGASYDLPWYELQTHLGCSHIDLYPKGRKVQTSILGQHSRKHRNHRTPQDHRQRWQHAACHHIRHARYRQNYLNPLPRPPTPGRCLQRSRIRTQCQ